MALATKLKLRNVSQEVAEFRAALSEIVVPGLREIRESLDTLTAQLRAENEAHRRRLIEEFGLEKVERYWPADSTQGTRQRPDPS